MSAVTPAGAAPAQSASMLPRNIGKNYLDPRNDAIDFTWYITSPVTELAPAESLPAQINIDAGTDFYWVATTYAVYLDNTLYIDAPAVSVVITDTGSQRQLMNNPVPIDLIASESATDGGPYRLILPRLFRANTIITYNFTSFDTTNTYDSVALVMHGFRLPAGAPFNL